MLTYNPKLPLFSIHIPKAGGNSLLSVLDFWFNSYPLPFPNNHPRLFKLLTPYNIDILIQHVLGCGLYYHYTNHQFDVKPRKVKLGGRYGPFFQPKPECVHGHFEKTTDGGDVFDFYPQAQQFITFLRDPLDFQLSLFFYRKKMWGNGGGYWRGAKFDPKTSTDLSDVDEWLEKRSLYMLNYFPWQLKEDNFRQIINDRFIHIGIIENFQHSIDVLSQKLNKPKAKINHVNAAERNISHSPISEKIFREKHKLEYMIYNYVKSLNQ